LAKRAAIPRWNSGGKLSSDFRGHAQSFQPLEVQGLLPTPDVPGKNGSFCNP
jgi:hypothetical protein